MIDDLANAAIEALHHAIGLRMAWRDEAMLDLEPLAQTVEHVLSARLSKAGLIIDLQEELSILLGLSTSHTSDGPK